MTTESASTATTGDAGLADPTTPRSMEANAPEAKPSGSSQRTSLQPLSGNTSLVTDAGTTRIAADVVAKIAGLATREIPGVYSMGTGMARRMGQIKSLVPDSLTPGGDAVAATQGVSVQVGEKEAAVDLELVTWYGQSIVDISDAVRRHVIGQVQGMTGLKVVEVNIQVDDIHVEDPEQQQQQQQQQQQPAEKPKVA